MTTAIPPEAETLTISQHLHQVLKPYRQQQAMREKYIALITQCANSLDKDDFFALDELLNSPLAREVVTIAELADCEPLFAQMKTNTERRIEQYRLQFADDLQRYAVDAGLPFSLDYPRFAVLPGIAGEIQFTTRKTLLNSKTLNTIDPQRIVAAALKLKQQLYAPHYEAETFISSVFAVYQQYLHDHHKAMGEAVPMQEFYLRFVLSLQSKAFFQEMTKQKFKGYEVDQLAVDIWRYFQSGSGDVQQRYALALRPGRSNALWLIDSQGEKRQITSLAFQERT